MVTRRAMARGGPGPGDEDFQQHLARGAALLPAGRAAEAHAHLEAAHRLQPRNEKVQNLLGLCCFKLGLLERAAEVYELLVRENPVDATLRVNLGLVYLKSGALQRAVRELETATDLAPEHTRAQSYLGLALAQAGEYGRAREHFLLAGSEHMAERMARAIAGEGFPLSVTPVPAPGTGAPPPARAPAAPQLEDSWGAQFGGEETAHAPQDGREPPLVVLQAAEAEAPAPPETPAVDPELDFTGVDEADGLLPPSPVVPELAPGAPALHVAPAAEPAPAGWDLDGLSPQPALGEALSAALPPEAAWEASFHQAPSADVEEEVPLELGTGEGSRLQRLPSLGGLAEAVQLPAQPPASVFEVRAGALCVSVRGELFTRLSGLLSVEGQVDFTPETRRQRGRPVAVAFGQGEAQLMRARGDGVLLLSAAGRVFLPVEMGEESAYFREEALFAFEEAVVFENGRMAVEGAPDLELVHLRGSGKVLLQLGGPLRSVGVAAGRPVVVPLTHLVGWQGELSPRVVALGGKKAAGVELTGQGYALLALAGR